jgi:glycosyltransferase involved in cell wall biosynthesis
MSAVATHEHFGSMTSNKILFSAPDTRPSLQHAARALYEAGLLGAYYTTFALSDNGRSIRAAESFDRIFHFRLAAELRRRAIREFPAHLVRRFPFWDVPRTLLSRLNVSERIVDGLHHRSLASLDRHVAGGLNGFAGVYAVNLAARTTFTAAKDRGISCIYEVLTLEARSYIKVLREEFEKFPALFTSTTPVDRTAERYIPRSDAEWRLADLIIVNSDLTRDSYAAAGFDISKVRVVPLGFPPLGSEKNPLSVASSQQPLNVLWAGNFSISKGAHYLVPALKSSALRRNIRVKIFGKQLLPPNTISDLAGKAEFRGTIPHAQLFAEYRMADVLILPTLSDGFAMVISEAMSQGLPVITTRCAGAAQFIEPGKNGIIVPPCDPAALVEALSWCADHPKELRAMGTKARETAARWQWSDYRRTVAQAVIECTGRRSA